MFSPLTDPFSHVSLFSGLQSSSLPSHKWGTPQEEQKHSFAVERRCSWLFFAELSAVVIFAAIHSVFQFARMHSATLKSEWILHSKTCEICPRQALLFSSGCFFATVNSFPSSRIHVFAAFKVVIHDVWLSFMILPFFPHMSHNAADKSSLTGLVIASQLPKSRGRGKTPSSLRTKGTQSPFLKTSQTLQLLTGNCFKMTFKLHVYLSEHEFWVYVNENLRW